jgi:hypothetical protein
LGGSADKMKEINSAWEDAQASGWYQKLAFLVMQKHAASLTGLMQGLRSGNKAFARPGQIAKGLTPKSGIAVAPRATTPPIPAPAPIRPNTNLAPKPMVHQQPSAAHVPKPAKQSSRGVSSTTI